MKIRAKPCHAKNCQTFFYRKLFPFISETLNVFVPPIQVGIEIGIGRCFNSFEDSIVEGSGFESPNVTTSG